jgi:ankyrin repeat protein
MYNVEQSNLPIVSELLDIGAEPNIQDKNKETALFKVLTMKDPTDAPLFISLLLKRGADKTIKNKKGLTAYNVALSHYNYNPNDLPALLLKPNGHIKPEFVYEILKPTKYEKDLYKYLSSSDESTSPKMRYEELLKRNKITTVASSVNDLFKIHIENPKEIFENYRNLSYSGNNIDCAYQSLFALGLIGQSAAKKGSKSSILVKRHYSEKIMGVSLISIKKHIISMFDLKPDDIIEYSFAPKTLVLINLNVYLKAYLDNNTCTIILIEFGSNNIGHFCVVFKQDDRVFVFDPQFTGKEEFPVFPLLQINTFYSQTHNNPMEMTEYSVFLFQNSVPAKPIRRDYCSYNLPLFVK